MIGQVHSRGEKLIAVLKPFAEKVTKTMCCPFYLVGSALTKKNPRDIDLYGRMNDEDFETHFGPVGEWERQSKTGEWGPAKHSWSRLCVVLTQWGWDITGLNLDVQVKPASNFDQHIKEKILLWWRGEMVEGREEEEAVAALQRGIRGLKDSIFWASACKGTAFEIQAKLVENHLEDLEGILNAMLVKYFGQKQLGFLPGTKRDEEAVKLERQVGVDEVV